MFILPVRTREDFLKISKEGEGYYTSTLIFISSKTPEKYTKVSDRYRAKEFIRIGFTVSKKISKVAVDRNRVKRQLREVFRQVAPSYMQNHTDYVIIARKFIINAEFDKIKFDLQKCFEGKAIKGFPEVSRKNKSRKR